MRNRERHGLPVRMIHCETAKEFIERLSPAGRTFYQPLAQLPWVFRGQPDAEKPLIASALRESGIESLTELTRQDCRTWKGLLMAEALLLWRFFHLADHASLSLVEDSQALRMELPMLTHRLADGAPRLESPWPPRQFLSLLAVMQHHGIPTRLLDWSRNPFAAAYFAARLYIDAEAEPCPRCGHAAPNTRPKDLVVWCLSLEQLDLNDILRRNGHEDGEPREPEIERVTVPATATPYLVGQEGLFTFHQIPALDLHGRVAAEPLDETLRRTMLVTQLDLNAASPAPPILFKLSLPTTEAPELLALLRALGVTAARLYPGYSGIAKALFDERRLEMCHSFEPEADEDIEQPNPGDRKGGA